jgi:hypothetical protein
MSHHTKEIVKAVLKFGIGTGEAVIVSLDDGKWDILDALNFKDPAAALLNLASIGIQAILEAAVATNATEWKELEAWAVQEFDIPDDRVEARIERYFKGGMKMIEGVAILRSARALEA